MKLTNVLMAATLMLALSTVASAQATQGSQSTGVRFRGFGDVGATRFSATRSVEAVLGSASGAVYGGGLQVDLPAAIFAGVRASVFRGDGQRVFVVNDQVFPLGVDTTVTIVPLEVFAGYRFATGGRLSPYAGGGLGWHHYKESSAFASSDENVDEVFSSYHVAGGVEVRVARLVAIAGEVQWTSVPDELGPGSTSVRLPVNEGNLGGTTVRVKFVFGR